ncbi:MAG: hypothetical protein ACFFDN_35335 [Candidatus Hodarchaeota archaeon]
MKVKDLSEKNEEFNYSPDYAEALDLKEKVKESTSKLVERRIIKDNDEERKDLEDFSSDQEKCMRITILGVIIAALGVIMQIFSIFMYPSLIPDTDLVGYLFLLIGILLGIYGYNIYRLSTTNPELYLKWKDPFEDVIKLALSLIFIILIATMLGSNYFFVTVTVNILPGMEFHIFIKILIGLLIGLSVGFFAAKNLYLYKKNKKEYQKIVDIKKAREKGSTAITLFKSLRMEKTYNRIVGNYWQVFGYCIIGALVLICINYVVLKFTTGYFIIIWYYVSVEQLFIIGGFVILQNRKIGFLILQLAIIWLIIWIILVPVISVFGPFIAILYH